MSWREISNEQNLRLSQKMLEQQGEINELKKRIEKLTADKDARIERIGRYLAKVEAECNIPAGEFFEYFRDRLTERARVCYEIAIGVEKV